MSHSLSPTNRSSIFGWVKNLKRGSLMSSESVNDIASDNDMVPADSRSPTKSINAHQSQVLHPHSHQEFLRPLLHHKSRSTNNVNRDRSYSFNQSDKGSSIRQHRDSFLQHNPLVDENSKYFGVPLEEAVNQASAKISILTNEDSDHVLQYGRIPIVVAKCGVYLKNKGLNVEGIFRVGGSSKRLKELQVIFNSPPDFGKKLNWDGYMVHDAASILRRYLNALPEPLITLELYENFRDPLRKRQRIVQYMKYKAENPNKSLRKSTADLCISNTADNNKMSSSEALQSNDAQPLTETNIGRFNNSTPSTPYDLRSTEFESKNQSREQLNSRANSPFDSSQEDKDATISKSKAKKLKNYTKLTRDIHDAIHEYKEMVDELPKLSKQLLFYILDLLAMVQNNSNDNLMSSRNLAAIFQPSILSHPNHDMDPVEYALSQSVVEFLIQYAYKLLPNQHVSSSKAPLSKHSMSTSTASQPEVETDNRKQQEQHKLVQQQQKHKNAIEKQEYEQPHKQDGPQTRNSASANSTPLDSDSDRLLHKPYRRQHSKSLSSSSNHEDFVGYQNNVNSKTLPIVDSDHEFDITDDDTSDIDVQNSHPDLKEFNSNDQKLSASQPQPNISILVSTP